MTPRCSDVPRVIHETDIRGRCALSGHRSHAPLYVAPTRPRSALFRQFGDTSRLTTDCSFRTGSLSGAEARVGEELLSLLRSFLTARVLIPTTVAKMIFPPDFLLQSRPLRHAQYLKLPDLWCARKFEFLLPSVAVVLTASVGNAQRLGRIYLGRCFSRPIRAIADTYPCLDNERTLFPHAPDRANHARMPFPDQR